MNNQDTTVTPNARLAEQRARIGMVTLQTEEKELVVSGETEAEGAEAEAEVSKIVVNRSVETTKKEPKAVVLEGEIAILIRKMEWKNKGQEEQISRAKWLRGTWRPSQNCEIESKESEVRGLKSVWNYISLKVLPFHSWSFNTINSPSLDTWKKQGLAARHLS